MGQMLRRFCADFFGKHTQKDPEFVTSLGIDHLMDISLISNPTVFNKNLKKSRDRYFAKHFRTAFQ